MNRYDRQIRVGQVGTAGQKKLAQACVLIIGCGATGSYSAEQLVRAGVGQIVLVDDDQIELSNLQRQALFDETDIGRAKVLVAAEKLRRINSEVEIFTFCENFSEAIFNELPQPDLLLDCSDNFLARELIDDYCLTYQLPWIFCAAAGTTGQVMAMKPSVGPCLSCVFPDLLGLEKNCETIGVVTALIPVLSGLQVALALQILTEPDFDDWERLQLVDIWPMRFHHFSVKKHCARCAGHLTTAVKFDAVCGGAHQAIFSNFDAVKFDTFCTAHDWPVRSNPLALAAPEITAFRNGRVLFYGDNAEQIFHELEVIF